MMKENIAWFGDQWWLVSIAAVVVSTWRSRYSGGTPRLWTTSEQSQDTCLIDNKIVSALHKKERATVAALDLPFQTAAVFSQKKSYKTPFFLHTLLPPLQNLFCRSRSGERKTSLHKKETKPKERPGWSELWGTWSNGKYPFPWQRGWK